MDTVSAGNRAAWAVALTGVECVNGTSAGNFPILPPTRAVVSASSLSDPSLDAVGAAVVRHTVAPILTALFNLADPNARCS